MKGYQGVIKTVLCKQQNKSGLSVVVLMIVVDTHGDVNPKETKVQLTTTAGVLDM